MLLPVPSTRDVIGFDLDSTLADTRHRRDLCPVVNPDSTWTDYALACADDLPIAGTVRAAQLFAAAGYSIAIVSYRAIEAYTLTRTWLFTNNVPTHHLSLGQDKVAFIEKLREQDYVVHLFYEDWPTVAAQIEAIGVPVVCVNPRYAELDWRA